MAVGSLLTPREVDRIFRYPRGRTQRLAKAGKIDHIRLPDGEIRFRPDQIEHLLNPQAERPPLRLVGTEVDR